MMSSGRKVVTGSVERGGRTGTTLEVGIQGGLPKMWGFSWDLQETSEGPEAMKERLIPCKSTVEQGGWKRSRPETARQTTSVPVQATYDDI